MKDAEAHDRSCKPRSGRALELALAEFGATLVEREDRGFDVGVPLADCDIVAVLNALAKHAAERRSGVMRLDLDGSRYTLDLA